jgi:hypothetical protein
MMTKILTLMIVTTVMICKNKKTFSRIDFKKYEVMMMKKTLKIMMKKKMIIN